MKYFRPFLFLIILSCAEFVGADSLMSVQVKETKLRSAPRPWANGVSTLKYGDTVAPIKVENDWVEGTTRSKQKGFVHISALTSKKVELSGSKTIGTQVDQTDVILAGKGFSKATEDAYAAGNQGVNFRAVDTVQAVQVPDAEIVAFMKEGKIGEGVK